MIFPELPRRTVFHTVTTVETPLREIDNQVESTTIDVDEWFRQHGLATDPAAVSPRSRREPINYWARDAWELYFLLAGMICWITYWYGVHRGAW